MRPERARFFRGRDLYRRQTLRVLFLLIGEGQRDIGAMRIARNRLAGLGKPHRQRDVFACVLPERQWRLVEFNGKRDDARPG